MSQTMTDVKETSRDRLEEDLSPQTTSTRNGWNDTSHVTASKPIIQRIDQAPYSLQDTCRFYKPLI